ncbi:hypothetical protein FRB96_000028 [Tulasnella sp. 330]|nr:hypothetical protein FRB96_000028 [Tulasnella sp. 330]KAG8882628.1 hypothetical protein FRB97_007974 [Tulasnella sp. 331]KAG8890496.1 hypothetical protein FRB98_007843 [Tulasnella sp. 332]
MVSFTLPPIQDNPDGSWGPSTSAVPPQFKDIPYAPYSKSEKLGRFADWTENEGGRQYGGATAGQAQGGGRVNRTAGRGGRSANAEGTESSAFGYSHIQDESSFSVVDNKIGQPVRRGGGTGFSNRGRGNFRGGAAGAGFGGRGGAAGGARGGFTSNRGRGGATIRRGWRDWERQSNRTRESSVPIDPSWLMLEEIDFLRMAKLRLEPEEPQELGSYGSLYAYDKLFDRITTKADKPLQIMDRIRFNTTTSDDPIIQELAAKNTATIYVTDTILSWLMCAPRSVYPWDIIITREEDTLYFDKRDGGPFDFITVNENAADPPNEVDKDKDSMNTPGSLSLEATFIDQHFSFQAVKEDTKLNMTKPNPFYSSEDTEPPASCGYRYRLFDLSVGEEEEGVKIAVRTQVEAFIPGANPKAPPHLVTLRTLNEFDSKAQGAGGAPDWRTKLDSQRGAVVATEMKNNSFKLAKWAVQSILAGAETMKIGYVTRASPRDNSRHVILSTAAVRPSDFAAQLNVSLANGWGIIRTIADICLKLPEGKYLLIKDPNKSVIRLYAVPSNSFTGQDGADGMIPGGEEGGVEA